MMFTKGPWFSAMGEGDPLPNGERRMIVCTDDECICVLEHNEFTGLHAGANADLIAAAPDLLEACRAAIKATGGSQYWNGETEKFLKLCEAAVSKAEGRCPDCPGEGCNGSRPCNDPAPSQL